MIHDLEIILHRVRSPVQTIDAVGVPVLSRGEDIRECAAPFERLRRQYHFEPDQPERMSEDPGLPGERYLSLDYQNQTVEMYRRTAEGLTKENGDRARGAAEAPARFFP